MVTTLHAICVASIDKTFYLPQSCSITPEDLYLVAHLNTGDTNTPV